MPDVLTCPISVRCQGLAPETPLNKGKKTVTKRNKLAAHRRKAFLAASSVCLMLYVGYMVMYFVAISMGL